MQTGKSEYNIGLESIKHVSVISDRMPLWRDGKVEGAVSYTHLALVLLTTAKVSRQKLNSDTDRAMIDDFLREETEAAR